MSENPMSSAMIMTILGFSDAAPTADVASSTQAKELLTKTLMRDAKRESTSEERRECGKLGSLSFYFLCSSTQMATHRQSG
jgi:hypothetical protein